MRHAIAYPVIAASLAAGLAGCASNGSVSASAPTQAQLSVFVAEVQGYASTACAFEPTAATIAQIATASSISASATEALAQSIADKVCGAVTAKGARYGSRGAPHVGKVIVHGEFQSGRKI